MNQPPVSRPRRSCQLLIAAVVASLAVAAVAETVVVKRTVNVLPEKDPFSDAVETVGNNTQLEILSRDGGWIRVRTPSSKEGFITKSQLPSTTDLASVSGTGGTSGADASLASKGLEPETETYAKNKNLKVADAQRVKDWGDKISMADVKAFAAAGHVGPKKHRN